MSVSAQVTLDYIRSDRLEFNSKNPTIYSCVSLLLLFRVLERIGARALVAHVRTFADFLVYEFSTSAGGQQLNKCIEILNDMVWKYNIVTLDRLILCLVSIDPRPSIHTHDSFVY